MASMEFKSVDNPDETRAPERTKVDVICLGGREVARFRRIWVVPIETERSR